MYSPEEQDVIKALQDELSVCSRPYQVMASKIGLSEGELLRVISGLQDQGAIRRIGAVLGHRALGIMANALVLWSVPEGQLVELGEKMAVYPEVTHCYSRSVPSGWRYRLFTMIHARRRQDCLEKVQRIAREMGIDDYQMLFSTVEYKKTGMQYQL